VVWSELRGVDRDQGAVAWRQLGNLVDGGDEAGDVGCAADGTRRSFHRQPSTMLDRLEVEVAVIGEADHDVAAAVSPGRRSAWCSISVTSTWRPSSLACSGPIRFRASVVLDEDHDLRAVVDGPEFATSFACLLVRLGGRGVTCIRFAVNARVDLRNRVTPSVLASAAGCCGVCRS